MINPRDIQQRLMGCTGFSLLVHVALGLLIAMTPTILPTPKSELPETSLIVENEADLPQGEQIAALPAEKPLEKPADMPAPKPVAKAPVTIPVPAPDPAPVPAKIATETPTKRPARQATPATDAVARLPEKKSAEAPPELESDVTSALAAARAEPPVEKKQAALAPPIVRSSQDETDATEASVDARRVLEQAARESQAAETREADAKEAEVKEAETKEPTETAPATAAQQSSAAAAYAGGSGAQEPFGVRDASELGELRGNKPPEYPEQDRLNRKQGTSVFVAHVNPDGTVSQVQMEQSAQSKTLDAAAASAMKRWRFRPGQSGWVRKGFTFSLGGVAQESTGRLRRENR